MTIDELVNYIATTPHNQNKKILEQQILALEKDGDNDNVENDGSFKAVIERTATEVTLPSDLTKIGDNAFYYNGNLMLTSLPSGVTSIGGNAFHNCTKLALTSLPAGLTSIGISALAREKSEPVSKLAPLAC